MRLPKGYVGVDHVARGIGLLAVLGALRQPEQVLGAEQVQQLRAVNPDEWYPIQSVLELMTVLDERVGRYGLIRMGRTLYPRTHLGRAQPKSVRQLVFGLNESYLAGNRGSQIGGWKVLRFEPGQALLEKTTVHHCAMEQGVIMGALSAIGCEAEVEQVQCFRLGAESCIFSITSGCSQELWDAQTQA